MEMTRSTLKCMNLTNEFWVEVMHITIYLLKVTPAKVVRNIAWEEGWSGKKPDASPLIVFGCNN